MRLTLRRKLLLVSLSLLALPWVGYRYVNEMERFLSGAQRDALLARAQAAAAVLQSRTALFARHRSLVQGIPDSYVYFVRSLETPVQLDGYPDEWRPWLDLARVFTTDSGLRVRHLLATEGGYLYALFLVEDDHIVYRDPQRGGEGDHLLVTLGGPSQPRDYRLSTIAPGHLNAYALQGGRPPRWEPAIQGEWQENAEGYAVELKLPLRMVVGQRIGFTLFDVDRRGGGPATRVATAGPDGDGVLLMPDAGLERVLGGMVAADTRAWVVDTAGRVLAVSGDLQNPQPREQQSGLVDLLFGLLIATPSYDFSDTLARASRLSGDEVKAALAGRPGWHRRATADGRAVIASAAFPISIDGATGGAVVVEQTTNAILSVQNHAIRSLALSTLLALGLAAAALLAFATRLSLRVRRLRDQTESAIAGDGRVVGDVTATAAGDEIGDLSRSFADMLRRLSQYNRYLETMAGQLAHELRTPVVVVKSSLENLELAADPDEAATYRQRALEGIERLGTILQRLSEATRLEQALQDAELESFDLNALVAACVDGYQDAYPHTPIQFQAAPEALPVHAAPDLLAQMLDKLVANGVEFAAANSEVCIALERRGELARLTVNNRGPTLPEQMRERLFEPMVSMRHGKGESPHLGLGLHIVRLVAEFHGGRVEAHNLHDGGGVSMEVYLPL